MMVYSCYWVVSSNLRNCNPCCNLLSRYSWFISLQSFVQDHGYHIPASEVAENEARLREARIKEREAVGHES